MSKREWAICFRETRTSAHRFVGALALVGSDVRVRNGLEVPAGARVAPATVV